MKHNMRPQMKEFLYAVFLTIRFFPLIFLDYLYIGKGLISQKNSVQPELTSAVDFDVTFYLFLNCSELLLILMIIFH